MEIKGIKKAVGNYRKWNAGGPYSPLYGYLMLDRKTGEVWTDCFSSFGHNSYINYHDGSIINLVWWAQDQNPFVDIDVNMRNVKVWAEKACREWNE